MINWQHWHNEPYLIGGLILLGWLYAIFTGPLRGRLAPAAPYPARHAVRFYAALVIFYLAVGSPLDEIGERFLLSAHMVQHMLLVYPAALLFLLGLPAWLVRPVTAARVLQPLLRVATAPVLCGIIFVLVFSIWHFNYLYEWALQDKFVHVIEHLMFFGAALFYWWPLASPSREFPAMSYPGQMIYLFLVSVAMIPVFAYVAFSSGVLYPIYEWAPRIIPGFSATEDQLLAAIIMRLGETMVEMIVFGLAFYRWYKSGEARPA